MSLKKVLLFVCGALFAFGTGFSQETEIVKVPSAFQKEWDQLESLNKQGLGKDELALMDHIVAQAVLQKNGPELFRALWQYPASMSRAMLETAEKHEILARFEQMPGKLEAPLSNIVHQFLAYQLENNEYAWDLVIWKSDFSVPCLVDGIIVNFSINDEENQRKIIHYHYLRSFDRPEILQEIDLVQYANGLNESANFFKFNPTLFDLMGFRLINHYKLIEGNDVVQPFSDGPSEDRLFPRPEGVLPVYEELQFFHWRSVNLDAYTYWSLSRLQYEKSKAKADPETEAEASEEHLAALALLKTKLNHHPSVLGVVLEETWEYLARKPYHWKTNPGAKDQVRQAHDLLALAVKEFPASLYLAGANDQLKEIESQSVSVAFQHQNQLDEANLLTVNYVNIGQAYLTIYHIDEASQAKGKSNYLKKGNKLTKVHEQLLTLEMNGMYNTHSKDFIVPAWEKTGEYLVLVTSTKDSADIVLNLDSLKENINMAYANVAIHGFQAVSRIDSGPRKFLSESQKNLNNTVILLALDTKTGKPVPGASVYKKAPNGSSRSLLGKTGKDGKFVYPLTEELHWTIVHKDDSISGYSYYSTPTYTEEKKVNHKIITDRGIYRPGQTIQFKVYAYEGQSPDFKSAVADKIEILLTDVNNNEIGTVNGVTSEYGTFAGTFTLPSAGFMSGAVYFTVNGDYLSQVLVEEYKRPGFETEAKFDKENYQLGDKVTISGKVKAYSGYGLSDSKVHVKIQSSSGLRYAYGQVSEVLDTVITSDSQGEFSISFIAQNERSQLYGATFSYDISATSASGETQRTQNQIFIGKLRPEWRVDFPSVVVSTEKAYGSIALADGGAAQKSKKPIQVELWRENPAAVYYERQFSEHEFKGFDKAGFDKAFSNALYYSPEKEIPAYLKADSFEIQSGDSLEVGKMVKNRAGNYQIKLAYISGSDTIKLFQDFSYVRADTKKEQHRENLWIVSSSKSPQPGEEISLIIGSSFPGLYALVEIYRGNELLRQECQMIKGRKVLKYKILNEDLGGISVQVLAMRNGIYYNRSVAIDVPFTRKKLNVKLETMREVLRPGAEEKWILSVSSPDGQPVSAELAAAMTDASLDQFTSNRWGMELYEPNYWYNDWSQLATNPAYFQSSGSWAGNNYRIYNVRYGSITDEMRVPYLRDKSLESGYGVASSGTFATYEFTERLETKAVAPNEGAAGPKPVAPEKARTNFSETAFFYPQLRMGGDNKFQLAFTLPDALTRWKFQALAHDKLMRSGYMMEEFVAQKELMADPNEPRFFRAGDEFVFVVNVVNLQNEAQNVTATLEWFDPFTNVVIPGIFGVMENQQLTLAAKGMQTVSWNLKIPKTGLDLIAYRVKVSSGEFSDGEEKVIPILSNRVQVIESVPIAIEGKGDYVFELPKLLNQDSPTLRNEKLVLEYNSNPLWSAVMAIPYLTEYPYDCSEQVFSKFFANKIAAAIVSENPLIQKVLSQPETNTPDKFLSALETNQDLKSIVLAETPWVLEAKSETEQKRRIAQLFDMNSLVLQSDAMLQKLAQMQNPDGGWSWFAGGESSIYITQHILAGFGHLKSLGLATGEVVDLGKALKFLDAHYEKQFKALKPAQIQKSEGLSSLEVQWLYMKSMIAADRSEASDYYAKCLRTEWVKFPLHVQAMAGIYFLHSEDKPMVQKICNSIRNRATVKKGLGTYWNENQDAYSWDRNAIETQASVIELFHKSAGDPQLISSMKLWLLNQKRGQYWKSTKTTAWACYALLMGGKPLSNENAAGKISIGNQEVKAAVSNTGYLKQSWSGGEIQPLMGKVTINQTEEAPAFGSLNLVYTEEMEKLSKNTSGMQIEKQVFVVRDGKEIPVTPATVLELGELLRIRLSITSDRNLEFVHVKDLRASGTEPVELLSGYFSSGNLYYYAVNRDAGTEFFLENLPKGKHHLSYELRVSGKGLQSTGYALAECLYAPEFRANSASGGIKVGE